MLLFLVEGCQGDWQPAEGHKQELNSMQVFRMHLFWSHNVVFSVLTAGMYWSLRAACLSSLRHPTARLSATSLPVMWGCTELYSTALICVISAHFPWLCTQTTHTACDCLNFLSAALAMSFPQTKTPNWAELRKCSSQPLWHHLTGKQFTFLVWFCCSVFQHLVVIDGTWAVLTQMCHVRP